MKILQKLCEQVKLRDTFILVQKMQKSKYHLFPNPYFYDILRDFFINLYLSLFSCNILKQLHRIHLRHLLDFLETILTLKISKISDDNRKMRLWWGFSCS